MRVGGGIVGIVVQQLKDQPDMPLSDAEVNFMCIAIAIIITPLCSMTPSHL